MSEQEVAGEAFKAPGSWRATGVERKLRGEGGHNMARSRRQARNIARSMSSSCSGVVPRSHSGRLGMMSLHNNSGG